MLDSRWAFRLVPFIHSLRTEDSSLNAPNCFDLVAAVSSTARFGVVAHLVAAEENHPPRRGNSRLLFAVRCFAFAAEVAALGWRSSAQPLPQVP